MVLVCAPQDVDDVLESTGSTNSTQSLEFEHFEENVIYTVIHVHVCTITTY